MPKRIDHKDRNPLNNKIENLRQVSHGQNRANSIKTTNKTGLKGVTKRPNGKFRAMFNTKNTKKSLGEYHTAEEAHAAFKKAHIEHYGAYSPYSRE